MKNKEKRAETIGSRIKAAREDAGYPQVRLAQELGFESATAISLIESGERNVSIENLEKIAKFLKKEINYFLGTNAPKNVDILTALRADPSLRKQDREAIEHIIKMAKQKRHGL